MLTSLLLLAAAQAGAPANFRAGVEGQTGFGPPVVSADGSKVALTRWDRVGLTVWDLETGASQPVSAARGAGFHPVWDGETLLFKAITGDDQPIQQALRWSDGAIAILEAGGRVGQPEALPDGGLIWASRDTLVRADSRGRRAIGWVGDVDLVEPDPTGAWLAWDDGHGDLRLRALEGGPVRTLDAAGKGAHPRWSSDGELLLHHTPDGEIRVVDPDTGALLAAVEGSHAAWVPGTHSLVFDRLETGLIDEDASPYVVRASSLWSLDLETGELGALLDDPSLHPRYPAPIGDSGDLFFVDTISGDLWRLRDGVPEHARSAPPSADAPTPPPYTSAAVWVPYLHQLWDTPDDYDGSWSCGPSSCVQVLGTWSVLPNADITCSWPYSHTSTHGWYIPNAYSHNGYTYDTWGVGAGGYCQGAHGYICREYGGALWAYMVSFMQQHGVDSAQVGTDFSHVISQTDAGYPMYASVSVLGYGHIIAVRGYLLDGGSPIHSIVVNDPYGNAGTGDWGNYDGEGITYDWPGYNNGHLEINVSQLFTAHGTAPTTTTEPTETTPVDTGTAPVDTGTAPAESEPVSEEPTLGDTGPAFEPEPAGMPGERALISELGTCSSGPSRPIGWAAVALAALVGRRRARRRG